MERNLTKAAMILGFCIAVGLASCGYFVSRAVEFAKRFDRSVTVKGLAESVVPDAPWTIGRTISTVVFFLIYWLVAGVTVSQAFKAKTQSRPEPVRRIRC